MRVTLKSVNVAANSAEVVLTSLAVPAQPSKGMSTGVVIFIVILVVLVVVVLVARARRKAVKRK